MTFQKLRQSVYLECFSIRIGNFRPGLQQESPVSDRERVSIVRVFPPPLRSLRFLQGSLVKHHIISRSIKFCRFIVHIQSYH